MAPQSLEHQLDVFEWVVGEGRPRGSLWEPLDINTFRQRRSGAGVEPTEPWATRPHRF
jgi:hypothetical protein